MSPEPSSFTRTHVRSSTLAVEGNLHARAHNRHLCGNRVFDAALEGVIDAEMDAVNAGRTLEHELKEKCFADQMRRESVAKLAIALARGDGAISEQEVNVLNQIMNFWNINDQVRRRLSAQALAEFKRLL